MKHKALIRFALIIFFVIPIGWYLFLQIFGSNHYSLQLKYELDNNCIIINHITVLVDTTFITPVENSYLQRVYLQTKERNISVAPIDFNFPDCQKLKDSESHLALANEQGIWGHYSLNRNGVDQFVTELDILLTKKNYGKGISR